MTTLFGIKNCDTVKKARRWLDTENIDYHFHDFRTDGITATQITQWIARLGVDTLVNKRSTTWKNLSDADKAAFDTETPNERRVIDLIHDQPTLIKRPLLETADSTHVGFNEKNYQALLK